MLAAAKRPSTNSKFSGPRPWGIVWCVAAFADAVLVYFAPVLWRSSGGSGVALGFFLPLTPVLLTVGVVILLSSRGIDRWIVAGCLVALTISLCNSAIHDHVGRRLVFDRVYPKFKSTVQRVMSYESTMKMGSGQLSEAGADELRVDSVLWSNHSGRLHVRFNTFSGPSLEAVIFSSSPIAFSDRDEPLVLVRTDDLGYWYFTVGR